MITKVLKAFGYRLVKVTDEPREVVQAFAYEMEGELAANDNKPGWHDASMTHLLDSVFNNCQQLAVELAHKPRPEKVRKHCADASNFLMMVADNWGELYPAVEGSRYQRRYLGGGIYEVFER